MCYNNTYLFYTYKGCEYGNIENKKELFTR